MSAEYAGKVVIVTGSSAGIGRAIALHFAKAGASVVIHGQNEERVEETRALLANEARARESRVLVVRGAIEHESTVKELVDATISKFGRIDVVVNNAAVMTLNGAPPMSAEAFDHVFSVNVKSVVLLTELALPHIMKVKGNFVNITSIGSHIPLPVMTFYTMTKAALEHYTRNMAVVYATKGIRFNNVSPGLYSTTFMTRNSLTQEESDAFFGMLVDAAVPYQRLGLPEECAAVVGFIASEAASYVSGVTWHVDGATIAAHGTPLAPFK